MLLKSLRESCTPVTLLETVDADGNPDSLILYVLNNKLTSNSRRELNALMKEAQALQEQIGKEAEALEAQRKALDKSDEIAKKRRELEDAEGEVATRLAAELAALEKEQKKLDSKRAELDAIKAQQEEKDEQSESAMIESLAAQVAFFVARTNVKESAESDKYVPATKEFFRDEFGLPLLMVAIEKMAQVIASPGVSGPLAP